MKEKEVLVRRKGHSIAVVVPVALDEVEAEAVVDYLFSQFDGPPRWTEPSVVTAAAQNLGRSETDEA